MKQLNLSFLNTVQYKASEMCILEHKILKTSKTFKDTYFSC